MTDFVDGDGSDVAEGLTTHIAEVGIGRTVRGSVCRIPLAEGQTDLVPDLIVTREAGIKLIHLTH